MRNTARIERGRTPSASASAVPVRAVIGSSISSASSQVAKAFVPESSRTTRSEARTSGSGTCSSGRRRPVGASAARTMSS